MELITRAENRHRVEYDEEMVKLTKETYDGLKEILGKYEDLEKVFQVGKCRALWTSTGTFFA